MASAIDSASNYKKKNAKYTRRINFHHAEENEGKHAVRLTSSPSFGPTLPLRNCLGITGLYLIPLTLALSWFLLLW